MEKLHAARAIAPRFRREIERRPKSASRPTEPAFTPKLLVSLPSAFSAPVSVFERYRTRPSAPLALWVAHEWA
jgi:hypothetical protein